MSITKKIVTTKFGVNVAEDFLNSFNDNDYYMYFGKHVPYGTQFEYLTAPEGYGFSVRDDVTNNSIVVTNTIFSNGDRVRYYNDSGFTAITGLVNNSIYYIVNSTDTTFQLSSTVDGTPISIVPKNTNEIHYISYASGRSISAVSGDDVESPVDSEIYSVTQAYDDMLFAKKITKADIRLMTKKNLWTSGTVYSQYDNTNPNLMLLPFYVVVDDITEYNVYKCLFNNDGGPSTVPPSRSSNTTDLYPVVLSDGYIWKFLYTITKNEYQRFSTTNYMPIIENTSVSSVATPGTIDVINISSPGSGYTNWYKGQFKSGDLRYAGLETAFVIGDDASGIDSYYENCVIKITASQTPGVVGQYRKITSYTGVGQKKFINIETPFSILPSIGDSYEIYPLVFIWGDGNEEEPASGRAVIDETTNSISSVEVLSPGKNYRNAVATLDPASVIKTATNFKAAVLNPIVSPPYGHGGDIALELGAKSVCISVTLDKTENNTIPTTNEFRSVGVIKNPKFSNIKVDHDTTTGSFTLGEEFVQFKNIKLYGTVETEAGSDIVFKENNGKISNTITINSDTSGNLYRGTGYDHRVNPNLVFTSLNSGGVGAAGTFVANTSSIKSSNNFTSNTAVNSNAITGLTAHPFVVGDKVRYTVSASTPNPPIYGLNDGEYYFIGNTTSNSVSLVSLVGGPIRPISNYIDFIYNISSNTTVITGNDSTNKSLLYTTGAVQVYKNATLLTNVTNYAQTNTSVITLTANAVSGETIRVRAFTNSNATSSLNVVNGAIVSVTVTNPGSGYSVAPLVNINTDSGGSGAELSTELSNPEITSFKDSFSEGDYVLISNSDANIVSTVDLVNSDYKIIINDTAPFTFSNNTISKMEITARGTITSVGAGQMILTNVKGAIVPGGKIAGLSSYATTTILQDDAIKINDKNPNNFATALQLSRFVGQVSSDTQFTVDEKIYQDSDNKYSMASARFHSIVNSEETNGDVIYASRSYGIFSNDINTRNVIGDISDGTFDLLSYYSGDFVLDSGEVIYIENVDPINRDDSKSEQIKIVLDF